MKSSNSRRTKLWSSIALCQSRSKYARREARREEKQSEENRGKLAAVLFCTFGALSEVHFLHSIYHFKAQEVKNPMLQTVHDSELKRRSYSHCKQITPKCCEISLLLREFRSLFVQCYGIPPEATRYMPQAGTLRTSRWKPISQPCEFNLLMRNISQPSWVSAKSRRHRISQTPFSPAKCHSCNSLARKYPRKGKLPSYINSLVNTLRRRSGNQPNSEDFSSEDERLSFLSLGVRKAGQVISVHGDALVYPCEPLGGDLKVINFVDYSLNQGAPAGHESAETPIGHELNGAVAGNRTSNQMVPLPLPLLGTNQSSLKTKPLKTWIREVVQKEQVDTIDRNDESTVDDVEENPTVENDGLEQQQEQATLELSIETQLRRSTRERQPSKRYTSDEYLLLSNREEPENYQELPKGKRALKNKWVLKRKFEPNRSQPSMNLEIEQLDVKTAFLHGDLEEEIYMEQPERFTIKGKGHLVCRLKKSLSGLKKAPRQWYKKFDSFMVEHGFGRTTSDHCVFVKKFSNEEFVILLLYVDDMLIVGHDTSKIDKLKKELSKSFEMKDLGPASQILDFLSPKQSEIEESSLESMAKMSGQGVRTHHRRAAERGL
ncbi:Retrovirus-related Pol polyprotein from transposon TNT 1-94 [Vitis vinifera]|uniref:Retrovirus-related Pol polyprotein from transposon TNT 1-94 n=1 Tax=Vitis vinifera TaxID=29760 RepID=A0A438KJR8_VITVI|nr:Retrovirus-related Pol polyprotein from transposon TNT 1-94 [Vitis vinifera]